MAESFQQPVTEVTQALRTSTVIQRLARRSTEPSGIVDVRPFQSESTFVPRWIVQRSALLDQIYKRYNSQDNALAEEADLVLAAPSQPVPREQITLPSLEQTAALSSLAIAKPVTQISTSEPSLEQSTAALSSLAITKPVTPTSTSDSSPSGKFRVTRKAIPLPNIKARQEKVQSLQGEIYIQSSKLSNQSPVAGEIASTLHQSQQPEQSLILPNRVSDVASQPPTSNAKNPTFSLQPGMEVNPNEKIPISTEVSQQINPSSQTQNQPTVVPEIGSIQDRNQQTESSLILPSRSRNETSQTSISAFNSISLSPTEIEQSSFRENSTEQDATQNQLPVAGEIASILHQFPQSEQSLILPKRISETSTTNTENPTFSLQPGMEVNPNEKIPISTEVSQQINPSSQTQNQPTVVPEIGSIQDRNQQTESSLILPSRSRNETSQTSISAFNSISLSPTEIEQSSFRENSTEQDATQNQLPVAGEIASILHQFPKSEQSLILPKRISETSTTNIENPTFS
ncbi:hypothetical protein, partial [Nostoc sp.]|uniref:hypothetical protein n=1 Tax=Nostoc sp. TaxID=1180 RepID=UPI002FFA4BA0